MGYCCWGIAWTSWLGNCCWGIARCSSKLCWSSATIAEASRFSLSPDPSSFSSSSSSSSSSSPSSEELSAALSFGCNFGFDFFGRSFTFLGCFFGFVFLDCLKGSGTYWVGGLRILLGTLASVLLLLLLLLVHPFKLEDAQISKAS